jgi:hypothetical protein
MAKQGGQDQGSQVSRLFIKGLNKDSDPLFVQEGMWTHARNASNNTSEGDIGSISNEESNFLCARTAESLNTPHAYIVGAISLFADKWIIFTAAYDAGNTNVVNSEVGLFESDNCNYRPIVQDPCLNFNKLHLITGAARRKQDCSWAVYWADGLNPDRYLNVGDPQLWPDSSYSWMGNNYYSNGINTQFLWPGVQWKEKCAIIPPDPNDPTGASCYDCNPINQLNCDATRLARLTDTPCVNVVLGDQSGTLDNGSYTATIAYTIDQQRVTNYFSSGYPLPVFTEVPNQGSIKVIVNADDAHFDEYELVIIANINNATIATRIGTYSSRVTEITLDQIKADLPIVSESELLINNPEIEKSEQIAEVNNYLLRVAPTTRFDFNYQPLANKIDTEWVAVEYPEDYYIKGGKNTTYLRDEVYSFFIRWIYNTGDKSASYHIPGRAAEEYFPNVYENGTYSDANTLQGDTLLFQTINTASVTSLTNITLPDGGLEVASGKMGYWQSSESYPDNQPEIWDSNYHCWTQSVLPNGDSDPRYNLCGKFIRHHKMPDNITNFNGIPTSITNHFVKKNNQFFIRQLGVRFKNIILPKDNDGNEIPGIVGYEILRGSRWGNKSILAKGMINNFRDYEILGTSVTNLQNSKITGLYANYPFNAIRPKLNTNNSNAYNYNFNDPYIFTHDADNDKYNQSVPLDIMSFHSPDTSFNNPSLTTSEVKLYGQLTGTAEQQFIEPSLHPEFKLLGNTALVWSVIGGLLNVLLNVLKDRKISTNTAIYNEPYAMYTALGGGNTIVNPITGGAYPNDPVFSNVVAASAWGGFYGAYTSYLNTGGPLLESLGVLPSNLTIGSFFKTASNTLNAGGLYTPVTLEDALNGYEQLTAIDNGFIQAVAPALGIATSLNQVAFFFLEGAQATVDILYTIARYRQYALEQIGHGEYDRMFPPNSTKIKRFNMEFGTYVYDSIQDLPEYQSGGTTIRYRINNTKRPKLAVIRTTDSAGNNIGPNYIVNSAGQYLDDSLMTLSGAETIHGPEVGYSTDDKIVAFRNPIASHYAGLKFRIENQYGQLRNINQVVITSCEQKIDFNNIQTSSYGLTCPTGTQFQYKIPSTELIFGGDTYINRFTEKNVMLFFYDWLYGLPNGTEYNYYINQMIPSPRFWVNSQPWDISDLNVTNIANIIQGNLSGTGPFPASYYDLDSDNYNPITGNFGFFSNLVSPKNGYFYTGAHGIRDFFVESDVLVDFRSRGIFDYQKFYSKYIFTNLEVLFDMNPQIITAGNFYNYDYSLSANKFFTQYLQGGILQNPNYDPEVSQLCFTYYPNRVYYSLYQKERVYADNWFTFLPLNFAEFKSKITSVKNFAKTGMFITFQDDAPLIYQGTDSLQLATSGTTVTVGDGTLFAQPPQNITASDRAYEYGSSQSRFAVVSSPAGLFYISQNQGKIFAFRQGLEEISQSGMKWWFNEFLPYKLLEDFPDYPHTDNAVAGIGCSGSYDNSDSILYFSKKDYKLKEQYVGLVTYSSNTDTFFFEDALGFKTPFKIDSDLAKTFFDDASWTISYDPKMEYWISFHDWHPGMYIPSKGNFSTIVKNEIWKHGYACNDFCNFYGVQYPFEVELPFITGQSITTLKNLEYYLECYKRDANYCVDQFHVLDYNFDQAVVYNSEQVSGYLNLNIFPKNNVTLSETYPKVNQSNLSSFDILFSKEENKYRFNQFWDITKNRGEFPTGSSYPPTGPLVPDTTVLLGNYAENRIWITEPNGYIKNLNSVNLNYDKPQLQRKRFRHYINFLNLSKEDSRNTNMILKIINTKNQYSPR